MAMKRERTVIQISEEHNQKELSKLINEKQHADTHMSKEQQKQEEMVSRCVTIVSRCDTVVSKCNTVVVDVIL